MAWLLVTVATQQAPQPIQPWRLIETPTLHVGLRPAMYVDNETHDGRLEGGAGATLQVTGRWL